MRGVALVSAVAKNIAKPIQQLRLPVLRHQAEVQITISAKPGAHEAHMGRTWTYARRKKKIKITLIEREEAGHFFVAWHTGRTPGAHLACARRTTGAKKI